VESQGCQQLPVHLVLVGNLFDERLIDWQGLTHVTGKLIGILGGDTWPVSKVLIAQTR